LSCWAKSTIPVLSETLISARRTGRRVVWSVILVHILLVKAASHCKRKASGCSEQAVLFEFLAQGAPVQPQYLRGPGLITPHVVHDALQQWRFDLRKHHVVDVGHILAIQVFEVVAQRLLDTVTQGPRAGQGLVRGAG